MKTWKTYKGDGDSDERIQQREVNYSVRIIKCEQPFDGPRIPVAAAGEVGMQTKQSGGIERCRCMQRCLPVRRKSSSIQQDCQMRFTRLYGPNQLP